MWTVIPLSFMTNFPFKYVVTFQQHLRIEYISHLIRYARACGSYHDFLDIGLLLTRKLLNQRFLVVKHKSWSFSVATVTLWSRICSVCRNHNRSFLHLWCQTTNSPIRVVPFQEKCSFHFVVLWKLLNGMD